ncbi:MAG TPA: DinB family protein [Thermomicrobiales bacterium]|nr:DinB family protein [Thermomicrobiales bacterium]
MQKHSLWAVPAPALAAHHDLAAGGSDEGSAVLTVPPGGRLPENVVATLASMPGELNRLVQGKSDEQLWQPAQDGGWGMVEILPHLRDWEVIIADRVDRILTQEMPTLDEYDDSLWAIEHDYRDQDPRAALAEFSERRNALVNRLREIDDADWGRVAILAKPGRVTLHWLLDRLCDHDAKHLLQARDVLA